MSDDAARTDQPEERQDPFTVFVDAHHRARASARGTKRFNAGEHAWLAGHGADRACDQQGVKQELFQFILRQDRVEKLGYGELVALSGDLYETPEELFEETPSLLPWRNRHDLPAIRELLSAELQWIEERAQAARLTPYPEDNIRMAWAAKNYMELALRNTNHFGWHNVLFYCEHHEAALRLASEASKQNNETFRRALYTNAFADHFLTDGFAAGHIRVPRQEILDWAQVRGFNEKIAGALSKLLHDQDGHVDVHSLHGVVNENERSEKDGLFVQNATGASWHTRCDGQLFTGQEPMDSPRVTQAVNAVAASVQELLVAWQTGQVPEQTYAATHFVPFPHPTTPPLIEKFPAGLPEEQIERLWDSVGWYSKIPWIAGLERHHIPALFAELPQLMTRFRTNVANKLKKDSTIRTRIAPEYLGAFRKIA